MVGQECLLKEVPFSKQLAPQQTVVKELKKISLVILNVYYFLNWKTWSLQTGEIGRVLGEIKAVICPLFIKWGARMLGDGVPAIKYGLKQCYTCPVTQFYPVFLGRRTSQSLSRANRHCEYYCGGGGLNIQGSIAPADGRTPNEACLVLPQVPRLHSRPGRWQALSNTCSINESMNKWIRGQRSPRGFA